MYKIVIISFLVISLCGCTTTRQSLDSARSRVIELEELNKEGAARNTELANLLESERIGNEELERILSEKRSELEGYFDSERSRIEAERRLADSLSGIFNEGSDIVEQLIKGLREIRSYLEDLGILAENLDSSPDSLNPDSGG